MKKFHSNTQVLFALAAMLFTVIPHAYAESSLVIQLNEKLNHEIVVFSNNASQLNQSSMHVEKASRYLEKAKLLPQKSNDFAYARSGYALEMAKDLESRMAIARESLRASDSMRFTIDQLIQASNEENNSNGAIFKPTDSEKVIQEKINQMQGLYAAFKSLNARQNTKLNQAFEALNMTLISKELNQEVNSTSNKNTFLQLRDDTEGVYFTVKAYIDSLEAKASYLKMIAVGGGVQSVVDRARKIISNGIGSFGVDSKEMVGMRYFSKSIHSQQTSSQVRQADIPDFKNRVNALADKARKQRPI